MEAQKREILKLLRDLLASSSDIVEVAVTCPDYGINASLLLGDVEEERIFLMSSALLSLCMRLAADLDQGSLDYIHFKGEYGYFIVMTMRGKGYLTALANKQAKLGLVFVEMNHTAREILDLLDEAPVLSSGQLI